jgi:hypothetical protein
MRTQVKLGIAASALTIFALGLVAGTVHSNKSLTTAADEKALPQTLIFNRKLTSTTVVVGNDFKDIGSGKVAIDSPLAFTCPSGGCTVTAEVHVQLGLNTISSNVAGLCSDLDGFDMPPQGCPSVVTIPTDDSFVAPAFDFAQSGVTAGNHTLQTFVFTDDGARRSRYVITYRLYTP